MNYVKKIFLAGVIAFVLFSGLTSAICAGQDTEKDPSIDALFLGEKGENSGFFLDMLNMMMKENITWRKDFHPEDKPYISDEVLASQETADTRKKLEETLLKLSARLKANSNPWFSPRYLAHMNADIFLPSVVGYMGAILYNANNVVYEGGPADNRIGT